MLTGGSDWGAFSAGAFEELAKNNLSQYDVYSGTGASAISAAVKRKIVLIFLFLLIFAFFKRF